MYSSCTSMYLVCTCTLGIALGIALLSMYWVCTVFEQVWSWYVLVLRSAWQDFEECCVMQTCWCQMHSSHLQIRTMTGVWRSEYVLCTYKYVLSTYSVCTKFVLVCPWYVQVHTCFCFWALLYRISTIYWVHTVNIPVRTEYVLRLFLYLVWLYNYIPASASEPCFTGLGWADQ